MPILITEAKYFLFCETCGEKRNIIEKDAVAKELFEGIEEMGLLRYTSFLFCKNCKKQSCSCPLYFTEFELSDE